MATGTLTADGTEQVVDTLDPGAPGDVFYYVDLENMQDGDTVIIREKVDVDGDGTYEQIINEEFSDSQADQVVTPSGKLMVLSGVPVQITLEQTGGTNRDYPWATGVEH